MKAAAWTVDSATLLQVVLVLAKVTGHVDWRWGFVLAPLELLALATGVAFVFVMTKSLDGDDGLDDEEDSNA